MFADIRAHKTEYLNVERLNPLDQVLIIFGMVDRYKKASQDIVLRIYGNYPFSITTK